MSTPTDPTTADRDAARRIVNAWHGGRRPTYLSDEIAKALAAARAAGAIEGAERMRIYAQRVCVKLAEYGDTVLVKNCVEVIGALSPAAVVGPAVPPTDERSAR